MIPSGPSPTAGAVFLSYASQDADAARRICDALRVAGVEVWFDQNELVGGDAWDQNIRRQIKECALFIPVISANTESRLEGYFRLEWRLADQRTHLMAKGRLFLVPIVIDETADADAHVPDSFTEVQWTRCFDDNARVEFARRIRHLLAELPVTATTVSGTARVPLAPPVSSRTSAQRSPPLGGSDVRPAIAVLPFAHLSPDPKDDYFADGITEEIINALGHIKGLRVAARSSSFAFKGRHEDLRVVAAKLRVGTILEGSVRKSGPQLRITAQLVDAMDGCQLWSERFGRELIDVFAIQDEIARAIEAKLQVALAARPENGAARPGPRDPRAYELLLKGRVLLARRGRGIVEALICLQQALALDPQLADAHALLGDCYRLHWIYGFAPPTEMMPLARAAAERTLALNPSDAEALATLANIAAVYDWDMRRCDELTNQALAIDPANVRALGERAICLAMLEAAPGEVARALEDMQAAQRIDPLNAWLPAIHAFCLVFVGRHHEALAAAKHAVDLDPANFTARWATVVALAAVESHDEALAVAEPALLMAGRNPRILAEIAAIHAARGNVAGAQAVHLEIQRRARTSYVGWAEQAAIAAAAREFELARTCVRRAVEAREVYLIFWRIGAWAPLCADPEGMKTLRSIGL